MQGSTFAPLQTPPAEAFVSLAATVGHYHQGGNGTPYFVSPFLRPYPGPHPMGVPFFANPPYGQFVQVAPAADSQEPSSYAPFVAPCAEPKRQSLNRRSSKKRLPPEVGSSGLCPDSPACPPVPLVPLPVSGNHLPMHGYPPGLPSPAMYYVPVFNHPYGGYHPGHAVNMMLPPPYGGGETRLPTDNGSSQTASNGGLGDAPQSSSGEEGPGERSQAVGALPPMASNGDPGELPRASSGEEGSCELLQTAVGRGKSSHGGDDVAPLSPRAGPQGGEGSVLRTDSSCTDAPLPANDETVQPPQNVQSGCSSVDTQPAHPTARTEAPGKMDSPESLSGPLGEGSRPTRSFQEEGTEKCLEVTVLPSETLPPEVSPSVPSPSGEPLPPKVSRPLRDPNAVQTETKGTAKVRENSSRCWADLFKSPPSREMNGFDPLPPRQNARDRITTTRGGKVANGKVPASNSCH